MSIDFTLSSAFRNHPDHLIKKNTVQDWVWIGGMLIAHL